MTSASPRKRQRSGSSGDTDLDPESDAHDATERACDACRTRRVKCDKTTPCSNCRRRGDHCHTTVAPTSTPRPRTSITKEHEKKLDGMAEQLATIERLLRQQQELMQSMTRNGFAVAKDEVALTTAPAEGHAAVPTPESQPPPDETSATTESHSTIAHKLVEDAIGGSPAVFQDSELVAALHSLKDMANKVEEGPSSVEYSNATWSSIGAGADGVDPPSTSELARMLQEADGSITLGFTPGLTVAALREKSETVFGSKPTTDPIRRLYVYGALRNLAVEIGGQHDDKGFAKRCRGLGAYFSIQTGRAVNDLKLIIPATAEAASALTMASATAMELCRPSAAQSLSSKAASVVLSLGYNRLSSMRNDSEATREVKILTFWMCYWLDSSFSVRLGRSAIIRPNDIAVPQLTEGSIIPDGWAVAFNYSTRMSGLQCKIVEQLYTPVAVQQTLEERQIRASHLVNELDQAWATRGSGPTAIALWEDSDAVMHYSTVCLVQHAAMPSASSESPALQSARHALRLNVEAWHKHKHLPDFIWAGHCHWTLLNGPITPFVVTFCHIVAHPFQAQDDLGLLGEFVNTMEKMRRFSDGMVRLHKLCDIFHKVAVLYVRAKYKDASRGNGVNSLSMRAEETSVDPADDRLDQFAAEDIDAYLNSMGFAPPASQHGDGLPGGSELPDFDSSFLMDWYQGNNSLMGFLEQDLTLAGDLNSNVVDH